MVLPPILCTAAAPLTALVVLLGASCASAQSASGPPPAPAAPAAASVAPPDTSGAATLRWLVADSTARTVTLTLEVTPAAGAPSALINGYRAGEVQVVVPLGWTVQWDWRSADSTATHSLVVMAEREKLPTEGGRPAFSNAMTRMVTAGLRPGQADKTSFTADQAGWYWLLCGVPGHAIAGEWIGLRLDPEAGTAGVKKESGK